MGKTILAKAMALWQEALVIFEALGAPEAEQVRGWLEEYEANGWTANRRGIARFIR